MTTVVMLVCPGLHVSFYSLCKLPPMKYLLLAFLFISCSKTMDHPLPTAKTNKVLVSDYLIKDLDSTVLSITMEPVLYCYGYKMGQTPRPCDIFVYATVTLSKPIDKGLQIELVQKNKYNDESAVTMIIFPNITTSLLNTGFSNQNNVDVPDTYRIGKVVTISDVK